MINPTPADPELYEEVEEKSPLLLWTESVGKVFKLITKTYGIRNVTYTQIKSVKETETPGEFDIEVSCAEITARVLPSRRAHSSGCKEGVLRHNEESVLRPSGFGEECPLEEFSTISAAILAHSTANLDLILQRDPQQETTIEVPIDLPHLKLTEMEASLLRNSPFLIKGVYLLSPNSRRAAFESINVELEQAARNSRLTDTCDPVYLSQKNEAIVTLRKKLNEAMPAVSTQSTPAIAITPKLRLAEPRPPVATPPPKKIVAAPVIQEIRREEPAEIPTAKPAAARLCATLTEKKNSIVLALRGKPSDATLVWERQNPSKEGPVFRMGKECGLLEFVRWAHISGRTITDDEAEGKNIRAYFNGHDSSYSGPDKEGYFPMFKIGAEKQEQALAVA